MVGQRRLGVILPLAEQEESIRSKFSLYGMSPSFAVASPFMNDLKNYDEAGNILKDKVDIILLDCMAYSEQSREIVSKLTGLPVIVSNSIKCHYGKTSFRINLTVLVILP